MSTDTPLEDDADVRAALAAARPPGDLEARVVGRLRAAVSAGRPRLSPPARRAAVAAAAVVAVVGMGWAGNAFLPGGPGGMDAAKVASNLHQMGLAVLTPQRGGSASAWDFGGGADRVQTWANWDGRPGYGSADPFAGQGQSPAAQLGLTGKFSYEQRNLDPTRVGGKQAVRSSFGPDRTYGVADDVKFATPAAREPQPNPFIGTQHDNIYTHQHAVTGPPATPADNADSILLPTAGGDLNGDGVEDKDGPGHRQRRQVSAAPPPAFKAGDFVLGRPATPAGGANATVAHRPDNSVESVDSLVRSARQYQAQGQYRQALAAVDQIQRIDPNNPYAAGTRQLVVDKATSQEQREYVKRFDREFEHQLNAADEKDVPYSDVLHYADDWPDHATGGAAVATTRPAVDGRKVIRTGTMAFDVDRFDTALATLTRVVGEAGGYIGTTDSQKLPNGKTTGTVTVRVPPERLDLLVLSLRALGDLRSQQIQAQDVTKEYTDVESELAADRAMQDRLLDLIRTGKGSIKDLLAAENELGTWRTKIEKATGQLRYYDAQVGLSTLAVTLSERDIAQAATSVETETADLGIEADDVERARDAAFKAIDDAHGRVVEAELKRLDAGQLAARVVADVPPEAAGATIDRLQQLGRVARLEVHRQQTASTEPTTAAAPARTERRPTRLLVSIYNLANVAPRRTTAVTLAAADPDAAYAAVLNLAHAGGRVVTSNLDRGTNATGAVSLEVPPSQLEAALATLRGQGEVLKRTSTENADTQNTTDAKVGLTVSIVALAGVTPRELVQQSVAAADVPTAYRALSAAAAVAHAHVRVAQLDEQDPQAVTATVEADVPRSALADFDHAVGGAGDTVARSSVTSADADNTVDSAVRVRLTVAAADRLNARETTALAVEVSDVDRAAADAQAVAAAAGGRVLTADVRRSPAGPASAKVVLDVPLSRAGEAVRDLRQLGTVRGVDAARDAAAPAGPLAHAHVEVDLATADALVADQSGPWANVRHGLSVGLTGLLWSLQLIVVGLCLLVPWAVVGYVTRRVWRRWRATAVA